MKNIRLKPVLLDPMAFMIFILILVKNCLQFDAIHDFSVWLRTSFSQVDFNRFESHTEKILYLYLS